MPLVYNSQSAQNTTVCLTSGTANTESDVWSITPGNRGLGIQAMYVGGKGAGLTALSGIAYRVKKWGTSSSAGTVTAMVARDPGAQAAKATVRMTNNALTSGTGGPTFLGGCISGAAGPGGWVAPNPDSLMFLEGTTTSSLDLFSGSGTVSLGYDFNIEVVE